MIYEHPYQFFIRAYYCCVVCCAVLAFTPSVCLCFNLYLALQVTKLTEEMRIGLTNGRRALLKCVNSIGLKRPCPPPLFCLVAALWGLVVAALWGLVPSITVMSTAPLTAVTAEAPALCLARVVARQRLCRPHHGSVFMDVSGQQTRRSVKAHNPLAAEQMWR